MCTLTYLPHTDGYIMGHSRDELIARQADKIERTNGSSEIIYPLDPRGKGSWIAVSSQMTVAILNGSRQNHQRRPPYRRSRGLVVLDAIRHENISSFISDYDFQQIEPFTLICRSTQYLTEVHWDGKLLDMVGLDMNKPHIWASWTLYDIELQAKRQRWFADWFESHPQTDRENLIRFHQEAGDGLHQLVLKDRGPVGTISITSIEAGAGRKQMICRNLLHSTEMRAELS